MRETTIIERQEEAIKAYIESRATDLVDGGYTLPEGWDADVGQMVLRLFRFERARCKAKHWHLQRMLLTPRLFIALAGTFGAKMTKLAPHFKVMDVLVLPTLKDDATVPFYFHSHPLPYHKG